MNLTDNQQLKTIVDSAPIGICILNAKNLVAEMANDKFLEIAGKPKSALIGKWYWETFAEAKAYYETALASVVTTGKAFYADEVKLMLIRHGREEWIHVTYVYAPVRNEQDEVSKVAVWVLENTTQVQERERVTAEKEAVVRERDRLYESFKQVPAGIAVLIGEELVFELANANYQQMLPGRKLLGRPFFEALPELVGTPIAAVLRNV